jgi:hypothetical protein
MLLFKDLKGCRALTSSAPRCFLQSMHTFVLHMGIEADAGFGLAARIRGPNVSTTAISWSKGLCSQSASVSTSALAQNLVTVRRNGCDSWSSALLDASLVQNKRLNQISNESGAVLELRGRGLGTPEGAEKKGEAI